jgi:hypothetical protein
LHNRMADNMRRLLAVKHLLEIDEETCLSGGLSVYLLGGSILAYAKDSLLMAYQLGFDGIKLCTPGFKECHYTPLAQFLQHVAPIYVSCLLVDLYGEEYQLGSNTVSSFDEEEAEERGWWGDIQSPPRTPPLLIDEYVPPIEAPV